MRTESPPKIRKLAHEILGYLAVAIAITLFLFSFLVLTTNSIIEIYFADNRILMSEAEQGNLYAWIRYICFAASVLFFVFFFLLLLGQKFSYLRAIIRGIEALRIHQMDYLVHVEGNDELTQLAERINYLSRAQRSLLEQEKQLLEDKKQLMRVLSHDIRTPLTSILSYTEYMQKKQQPTEEELQSYFALMLKKEQQMKELTDRLLDNRERKLEYIEDGRMLMLQLTEEWEEALEEDFECAVDIDCPAFQGEFDVQELRRIFDNLASNVAKYADPSQAVALRILQQESALHIVQQNAKRADHKKDVESHGIGLHSIGRIAAGYQGSCHVQDSAEHFSIHITLPHVQFVQTDTDCGASHPAPRK